LRMLKRYYNPKPEDLARKLGWVSGSGARTWRGRSTVTIARS